jgi:hypothetical protein
MASISFVNKIGSAIPGIEIPVAWLNGNGSSESYCASRNISNIMKVANEMKAENV